MATLPADFNNALYRLELPEPFRQIVEAAAIAGPQFSIIHGSNADNKAVVEEMVKAITDQINVLVWQAGGDMLVYDDSYLAYRQAVADALHAGPQVAGVAA